jgi:bifunctional UDP-N-acetylglucosamine pyrophosphorylase/glucosamine-1-phosphate N-acetyltransferase
MTDVHVVVLAAGKGTRMKSSLPKVAHRIAGVPMIEYVVETAARLSPRSTTIVVGYRADAVKDALARQAGLTFVVQEPQLGTAHALLTAEAVLEKATGTLLLLSGDVPLLTANTLRTLVERHTASGAALTVVTAVLDDPRGYGRIIRSGQRIARIVEEKDASSAELELREINAGIYAFALDGLFGSVRTIGAVNSQNEHYLPDLVAIYRQRDLVVETLTVASPTEIQGINNRAELAAASRVVRQAKNAELMAAGVTIDDPWTTYVDRDVKVGADTVLHPGVSLEGRTTVGQECEIHSVVRIVDSSIADRVTVLDHCVMIGATVATDARIGPFTHLRPASVIGKGARVGNFVELKKTVLGSGSKSMHLAYLGDAIIGENVNIGAGTITCNYDGSKKHTTTIENGAFIGSDTQIVAPVTVGEGAYVGTGSTIRENVPPGALAVSAGKQRNIEGWVEKRKKK